MKKLLLKIILCVTVFVYAQTDIQAQTVKVLQKITASATASATADIVIATGTNAITLTLPASPADGRVLTIVNHTTQDLTFNVAINIGATKTSALLSPYVSEFLSGISTNRITIVYNSTTAKWHLIG